MATEMFEVWLWNAANTTYRVLPRLSTALAGQVQTAEWRITRTDGYADATLTLSGSLADASGVGNGRRVEFWGVDASGNSVRMYRGYISRIEQQAQTASNPARLIVSLLGIWQKRSKLICRQRWAFPSSVDIATAWSYAAQRFVAKKYPYLSLYAVTTGQTVDTVDGYRVTFGDLSQTLIEQTGGFAVSGGDVDPLTGADRLFFRPFGAAASPSHVLPFPDPAKRTVTFQADSDASKIVNVLELDGGTLRYPNLLAQSCNANTAFEAPVFNGTTSDLLDPGTLYGGASYKPGDGGSGYGTSEDRFPLAVYDNPGEGQTWTFPKSGKSITAADNYTFWTRLRTGYGGDVATVILRIIWQTAGGAIIRTDTQSWSNATGLSGIWDTYTLTKAAPATATKGYCQVEVTARTGSSSVVMGAPKFYDATVLLQDGWELHPTGIGVVNNVDWVYETDAYLGAYCVSIDATSSDADNDDVVIRPTNNSPFTVSGAEQIRFSVWVKPYPGSASPKLQLQLFDYSSSDSLYGDSRSDVAAGSFTGATGWTRYDLLKTVNTQAAKCRASLAIRSSGKVLVGAMQVRDSAAEASEFVRANILEGNYRADTLGSGSVAASVTTYDEQPERDAQDNIATQTDAQAYALAKFAARSMPVERPQIELVGEARDFWPGQYVRGIGSSASAILPSPLPIAEVEGRFDGSLVRLRPYLQTERESEVRVIRALIDQQNKKGRGNGGSGGGAAYSSRSSTGGGITAGYSTIQDEGSSAAQQTTLNFIGANVTVADDSGNSRTNVTIADGISTTVTLEKITSGGANGSLTFTNGLLTAKTDPT